MITRVLDAPVTWRSLLVFYLALQALEALDALGGAYLKGLFGLS